MSELNVGGGFGSGDPGPLWSSLELSGALLGSPGLSGLSVALLGSPRAVLRSLWLSWGCPGAVLHSPGLSGVGFGLSGALKPNLVRPRSGPREVQPDLPSQTFPGEVQPDIASQKLQPDIPSQTFPLNRLSYNGNWVWSILAIGSGVLLKMSG